MKLSELSTDKGADVLCEIAPHIINIMTDVELVGELKEAVDFNDSKTFAEKIAKITEKISKIVPILLKKRRADLFGILAILNEKTVQQISRQTIISTMKQIRDITKDKELLDFFKSCTDTEESE